MAARNRNSISALSHGLVVIAGSFAPNGSSAVAASGRKGNGYTVARTGVGAFTITFSDKWVDLVHASAHLRQATAGDQYVQLGTYSASAKTLTLTVWDISAAAAADVAADADNRISFMAVFSNTSALPSKG